VLQDAIKSTQAQRAAESAGRVTSTGDRTAGRAAAAGVPPAAANRAPVAAASVRDSCVCTNFVHPLKDAIDLHEIAGLMKPACVRSTSISLGAPSLTGITLHSVTAH
jgi:hypothetical protein